MKKFLSVILAVLFSLSCFAATGFSQSDCGQACCCSSNMQGMHHTTRLQAPVDSSCCAPTSAHPCGFTKNRNIELPAFTVSAGRITPTLPSTRYSFKPPGLRLMILFYPTTGGRWLKFSNNLYLFFFNITPF
jgi:hypothetical protein